MRLFEWWLELGKTSFRASLPIGNLGCIGDDRARPVHVRIEPHRVHGCVIMISAILKVMQSCRDSINRRLLFETVQLRL